MLSKEFLEILFSDLNGSYIEIRSWHNNTKKIHQQFCRSIDEINIEGLIKDHNIYFGACLRTIKEGNKKSVKEVPCLWTDLDGKDYIGGKEEAFVKLQEFPIRPTAVNDTGHGYHVLWLLREPFLVENEQDIVKIESYLKAITQALGGDSSCAEIARVLRFPGTYNYKYPDSPKLVTNIEFNSAQQYNLSDFDPFLLIPKLNNKKSNPAGWIAEALLNMREGNRNPTFTKIIGRLHRDRWSPSDIYALLEPKASEIKYEDDLKAQIDGICKRYINEGADDGQDKLTLLYGKPYYQKDKGQVTSLNESYWAGQHFSDYIELYEPVEKEFYRYDSKTGLYLETSDDVIKQEVSRRLLESSRNNKITSLEQKRTNSTLNNIIGHLRGIAERRGCFEKEEKSYVHLANGVITFSDDGRFNLVNFSPDFYSRNQSPIAFDPNARCERFINELLLPAVNSDDVLLIQKYMGMCLLGDNRIQRFLILDGLGGRGKTQLALVIQNLIGLVNVMQLRTNLLNERFELFRFRKKSLLVGVDVPGTFLSEKSAQVIKGLVGGDMFSPEKKNATENFQIKGNFCTVITSNSRLHIKLDSDDTAWGRRLLIVRYEAPPPAKKIPNFADFLIKEEGSGILNWALEGLSLLLEDVKNKGDITLTDKQAGRIDALLAESDSVRHFLKENVVRDGNSNLTTQEIIEAYAEYCPARGWVAKPITTIYRELEGLMLELFRTSKSNSIERTGKKSNKGFRFVGFKKDLPADVGWEDGQ